MVGTEERRCREATPPRLKMQIHPGLLVTTHAPYGSTMTAMATSPSSGSLEAVHETLTTGGPESSLTRVRHEQELPPRRPRNNHEWSLWRLFDLLFSQVSRDERPRPSMDRVVAPTRGMYV